MLDEALNKIPCTLDLLYNRPLQLNSFADGGRLVDPLISVHCTIADEMADVGFSPNSSAPAKVSRPLRIKSAGSEEFRG